MNDIMTENSTCKENVQDTPLALYILLINALVAAKCPIRSHGDYPKDHGLILQDGDDFDFIVIGSGASGSVVANKLSENKNWRVLVLEAGEIPSAPTDIPLLFFTTHGSSEDWNYKSEVAEDSCLGFKDKRCRFANGKALGGSSVINDMIYLKGNKKDYDKWAELGNSGWDWNNVKEYFTAVENVQQSSNEISSLGINGLLPLTIVRNNDPIKKSINKGLIDMGIPNLKEENPDTPLGSLDSPLCIFNGIRSNNGKEVLGAITDRKNLFVSTKALVEKIIIEPNTKTANGVRVKIGLTTLKLRAKKEIILSAGSINSPQLLMLSGIGPQEHLKDLGIPVVKNLPVGRNLQDHISFTGFDIKLDLNATLPVDPTDVLYEYFQYKSGVLSTIGISNYVSFVDTKNETKWPNIRLNFYLFPPSDELVLFPYNKALGIAEEIFTVKEKAHKYDPQISVLPTLLNPKSRGKVMLRSSKIEDKPLIYTGYFTDKDNEDEQIILESIRLAEKLFEIQHVKNHNPEFIRLPLRECDKHEFKSDDYWKCAIRHLSTSNSQVSSTCTMGAEDDGTSVVDSRLRVHGISNLRVVDSSVMPLITSGNTHAPAMMIGYKAGVMLTKKWRRRDVCANKKITNFFITLKKYIKNSIHYFNFY